MVLYLQVSSVGGWINLSMNVDSVKFDILSNVHHFIEKLPEIVPLTIFYQKGGSVPQIFT